MILFGEKEFRYPTICISIIDKYLVFTTKKNGSRYFEELSYDIEYPTQINTINLSIHNSNEWNGGDEYKFSNYFFDTSSNRLCDENIFLKKLGIDNLSELFSEKIFEKFELIFILRNPMERFYTGLFEKIDSILGQLKKDEYSVYSFNIIKKYFNIDYFQSLSMLPQESIDFILNEYCQSINSKIFNDEHLSFWNHFVLSFLEKENLLSRVKFLDLNTSDTIDIFKKNVQPSNKIWINNWLNNELNKNNNELLLKKFKKFFDIEIESYNKLLTM